MASSDKGPVNPFSLTSLSRSAIGGSYVVFSVQPLCSLCLCGKCLSASLNHRDTENTEVSESSLRSLEGCVEPQILHAVRRLTFEKRIERPLAARARSRIVDLVVEQLAGKTMKIGGYGRAGRRFNQRLPEIDGIHGCAIVALNESDHSLAEEAFNLLLIEIDILTPAIHHQSNFPARVAETIEYLQRASRAPNRVDFQCQHHQDLVRVVQSRNRDGVEAVWRVDDHVVIPQPQQFHHFVDVLWLDIFSGLRLCRRREQRNILRMWCDIARQQRIVKPITI